MVNTKRNFSIFYKLNLDFYCKLTYNKFTYNKEEQYV